MFGVFVLYTIETVCDLGSKHGGYKWVFTPLKVVNVNM